MLGKNLVTDTNALEYIENYFKEQGQEMTPNNKQQALVIEGAKVLQNNYGMAPGMLVEYEDKKVILLPGHQVKCNQWQKNELLPYLMDEDRVIHSEQLRFAGIGESKVETELMDLIDSQENPTIAPLAGTHEVYIRLTANANTENECKKLIEPTKEKILARIGDYYYGSDDIVIEQALMNIINKSFSIYDGVTNGALYTRLKNQDLNHLLKGQLPDSSVFVSDFDDILDKLKYVSQYVKDLYKTDWGIALLHNQEQVYLGYYDDSVFKYETFKMPLKRNILKSRSQNYAMINLINWFK